MQTKKVPSLFKVLAVVFAVFLSVSSYALPENFIQSQSQTIYLNFLNRAEPGQFQGVDGLTIRYFKVKATPQDSCVVAISPGQGEPALAYAELIEDIQSAACTVFVIDHRGQGFSDRVVEEPRTISHVKRFSDYVQDFKIFVSTAVQPENYRKSFLIAHSMGGAIASGYLALSDKEARSFSQVILLTPMHRISKQQLLGPERVSMLAAYGFVKIGQGGKFVLGDGPFSEKESRAQADETHSDVRFDALLQAKKDFPSLQIGGVSNSWVYTTIQFTRYLRKKKNVFQVPTTIFQAGDDSWVDNGGNQEVCQASPRRCRLIHVPRGKHDLNSEVDEIRTPIVQSILKILLG